MDKVGLDDNQKLLLSKESIVQDIVQDNYAYYRHKWEKHPRPLSFCGWNWAGFFFAPFWLAYRHMYSWTVSFFLLYLLGILTNSFIPVFIYYGILPTNAVGVWQILFPIMIHLFFGMKSNAIYSKRIIRLLFNKENPSVHASAPLFMKTGRSWISALLTPLGISIFLVYPTVEINEWSYNPKLPYGTYVYSDETIGTPQGVLDLNKSAVFIKYSSRINLLYYGEDPVSDRTFQTVLYFKERDSAEWSILRERSFSYFSSSRITLDLIDAEDPATPVGHYRLEIIIDNQVKGQQQFEIKL